LNNEGGFAQSIIEESKKRVQLKIANANKTQFLPGSTNKETIPEDYKPVIPEKLEIYK